MTTEMRGGWQNHLNKVGLIRVIRVIRGSLSPTERQNRGQNDT
jgi:hypothetical protein